MNDNMNLTTARLEEQGLQGMIAGKMNTLR